jgi:mono/diheme cytochrome c family protein
MKQVRGRTMLVRSFAAVALFTVFAVGGAVAETGRIMSFEVPYQFTAGAKAMPAGNYTFSLMQAAPMRLKVQSEKGGSSWVNVVAPLHGPNELFRGGYLVFEKTNSGLTLSEIWMAGMDGALVHAIPSGHERVVVASGASLDANRNYSGKSAYSVTCAKCHGEDGKGDPAADKFFDTKIPRLVSAEVQAKSDDDIRKQITQGSGKMAPVEVDEHGFRHRLPPQYVDAVVAYVRTLKG